MCNIGSLPCTISTTDSEMHLLERDAGDTMQHQAEDEVGQHTYRQHGER